MKTQHLVGSNAVGNQYVRFVATDGDYSNNDTPNVQMGCGANEKFKCLSKKNVKFDLFNVVADDVLRMLMQCNVSHFVAGCLCVCLAGEVRSHWPWQVSIVLSSRTRTNYFFVNESDEIFINFSSNTDVCLYVSARERNRQNLFNCRSHVNCCVEGISEQKN